MTEQQNIFVLSGCSGKFSCVAFVGVKRVLDMRLTLIVKEIADSDFYSSENRAVLVNFSKLRKT